MIYKDLPDFFACVRQESGWSKDTAWLTHKYAYVPVLVYGTHQKDYTDHALIKSCPVKGYGVTARGEFTMHVTGDGEPVAFQDYKDTAAARIKGEVYLLPPPLLFKLDQHMFNGLHFVRQSVPVRWWEAEQKNVVADERQDYLSEMFMYVGNKEELGRLFGFNNFRLMHRYNTNPTDGYFYVFNPMDNARYRRKKLAQDASDTAYTHEV